jgi:hypothetical protein
MARREKKPITTMMGLLRAMTREYGSRKTGAILKRASSTPPEIYVEEYFDDGKGHSGAFTSDRTDVTPELFDRAWQKGYLHGKFEIGYVSDWEFKVTDFGTETYYGMVRFADAVLKRLSSEGALPLEEILIFFHQEYRFPAGSDKDILDWLASEGRVDSHEHAGRQFLFLIGRAAV